jgi:hypothetical protein
LPPWSLWLALVAGLGLAASPASAFDPAQRWRSLETPLVRVHYPEGLEEMGVAVARAAERSLTILTQRLGWRPDLPLDIVLNDDTDIANGSAQSYPYNLVILNAVAPDEISELSHYHDWVFDLVVHEIAHIVHLDTVGGFASLINTLFGRWYFPNSIQPRWFVEGIATYFESALTGVGRVHSSSYDMMLRAAVLEGEPLTLDEAGGSPTRWPQGTVAYLYGSYFLDFIARRYGEEALGRISQDYASRIIPFAINLSVKRATGADYPTLYAEFMAELWARFGNQTERVLRLGRREGEALTKRGQEIGPARVAPDGSIFFVEAAVDRHAMLRQLSPGGQERDISRIQPGSMLALVPGKRQAIVSQVEYAGWYRTYSDLFSVDLDAGSLSRLTDGWRVHSPDVSADGSRLVFVRQENMRSWIDIAPLGDLRAATKLADLGPGSQVWSPRFSADGSRVVFSAFAHGQRDLYVVDCQSLAILQLTSDPAVDGAPVFSADGRWVLFHSDADGIFNLYAVPASGGPRRRLSRVFGGAFRPELTPDGRALIYQSYGSQGFDLARLPLECIDALPSEEAITRPPEDPEVIPATVAFEPPEPTASDAAPAAREGYTLGPYRPWLSLRPHAWLPIFSISGDQSYAGAAISGQDALGQHSYAATATYRPTQKYLAFDVGYANAQFHPGLQLEVARTLSTAALPYVRNMHSTIVDESVWVGELGTSWPLVRSRDAELDLTTSYRLDWRLPLQPLRFRPDDTAPIFPDEGRFQAVRLGVFFSNAERYVRSISAERGLSTSLGLRLEDPWVGSQYSATSVTLDTRAYVPNPLFAHHVLALSLFLGYGKSNYRHRSLFSVSGVEAGDLLLDALFGRVSSSQALRGFPRRTIAGDAAVIGSVEYRLPLVRFERGPSTLPLYLGTLHAAAFVDGAALAPSPGALADNQHYSAGGELRLGATLGYYLPVTFRMGYGRGLFGDEVQSFFFMMGSWF